MADCMAALRRCGHQLFAIRILLARRDVGQATLGIDSGPHVQGVHHVSTPHCGYMCTFARAPCYRLIYRLIKRLDGITPSNLAVLVNKTPSSSKPLSSQPAHQRANQNPPATATHSFEFTTHSFLATHNNRDYFQSCCRILAWT